MQNYGTWVYALLFLIIFVETGVVVMPFLPGDSLLFVVGAMCGVGLMSYPLSVGLLLAAAVLGNQSNYTIGRYFGPKVFQWEHSRFFNKQAFDQAHAFYEKYGGITIVAARFMPFLRTFAPFVAGVAQMTRSKFSFYDVTGGALWVGGIVTAGYFFGSVPWVKVQPGQDHLGHDPDARPARALGRVEEPAQVRPGGGRVGGWPASPLSATYDRQALFRLRVYFRRMNAPQSLSRWTEPGSSRVPFWAYTDAQLYQRELEKIFYGDALVLRRPGSGNPQRRRLQAQLGRRAPGDHGARSGGAQGSRHRHRHPRRGKPLRPSRRAVLPAAARQRAQLRVPLSPVDLQAQRRAGGPAVQGRRQGRRLRQRRHAGATST